jgi:hypothetical protein
MPTAPLKTVPTVPTVKVSQTFIPDARSWIDRVIEAPVVSTFRDFWHKLNPEVQPVTVPKIIPVKISILENEKSPVVRQPSNWKKVSSEERLTKVHLVIGSALLVLLLVAVLLSVWKKRMDKLRTRKAILLQR